MGLELDFSGLIRAVELKAELVPVGLADVANKAMKDVALRTIGFTPAVPSSAIAEELRRTISTRYTSKTGKTLKRPKHTYAASDEATLVLLARLWKKQGGKGSGALKGISSRAELLQMALAMVNGRVRSASFLRAGYLAAAEPFGGTNGSGETHLYHAQGGGVLATPQNLMAEIHNDVPTAHWKNTAGGELAYEAAENALQSGLDYVERDLLVYVDRKLREAGFDA